MPAMIFSALSALVFFLDARVPLGANVPLLYIVPVLIAIWHARGSGVAAPAICTGLIVLRVFWLPSGDWFLGVFNRALTLLALWSSAILLVQFKRTDARLREQEDAARFGEMALVIAHELRNALAGIRTAVDVFGAKLAQSERDQAVRREMANRVESMEHFIADMLMLSRPMQSRLSPHSLAPVVQRAAASLKSDPQFSGISVDIGAADAIVPMDEALMESALRHLLFNAAQAMNGAGAIDLAIEHSEKTCRLTIRDQGPGIGADVRAKIFERFFTTRSHGRGLGLPIAKRAIDHHGGSLEIESEPGAGTTVIVTLPRMVDMSAVI